MRPLERTFVLPREVLGMLWVLGFAVFTMALVPVFSGSKASLFFVLIVGVLAAGGIIAQPHFGVFLILFVWSSALAPAVLGSRFLGLPYVVSAVLAIPLGVALLRDRDVWILRVPQFQILLAIGGLWLASAWWGGQQELLQISALDRTDRYLYLFAARLGFVVFFAYFVSERKPIETMALLIVGMIAVAAVDSWTGVFGDDSIRRAGRGELLAKNPNRLAFECLFGASVLWFFLQQRSGRGRILTVPLLLFLPLTALASGSRAGLIQALTLGGLLVLDRKGPAGAGKVKRLLFVAATGMFLVSMVPEPLLERATNFDPHSGPAGKSIRQRFRQLDSAVGLFAAHPFLGIGLGKFESVSQATHGVRGGVHNSYVRALTEGGIGALVLY
ncbi:MAG: O-antigen ligase family protein, partial [Candidatus Binatia bacterium]